MYINLTKGGKNINKPNVSKKMKVSENNFSTTHTRNSFKKLNKKNNGLKLCIDK